MVDSAVINTSIDTPISRSVSFKRNFFMTRKRYAFIFGLLLNLLIINDLIRMLFSRDGSSISIVQYISYGIVLLFSVIYFFVFKKPEAKKKIVLFCLSIVILTILSMILLNETSFFLKNYIPVLLSRCLPAFILAMLIDGVSSEMLANNLIKYRFLWLAYAIVGAVFISKNTVAWGQYAGNFGFNLLFPFSVCFYLFLREARELKNTPKKLFGKRRRIRINIFKWIVYSAIFLVFIVLRGSRTAFLCGALFAFFSFFFSGLLSKKSRTIVFFVLLALVLISTILLRPIVSILSALFPSSRTLRLLLTNISFDSGRSSIQSLFIEGIKENPFAFRGFFSDRFYYSSQMDVPLDVTNYPHNFAIEIFYQFGCVLGVIFLLMLLWLFVKTMLALHNSRFKDSFLIFLFYFFFVSGVIRLFFSSSYLTTFEFYAFVGIAIKINILASKKPIQIPAFRS